jgi:integrase
VSRIIIIEDEVLWAMDLADILSKAGHSIEGIAASVDHALRAGFATSAAHAGVPAWKIRQQTGHSSDTTLGRYIRDGELFLNNAAGTVL